MPLVAISAATLCAVVFAAAAGAQTVYRCGPAGNAYSAQPCPEGRQVDVGDPRSAEQIAAARAAAADQRRLAAAMARDRNAAERAAPPQRAGAIGPLPTAPEGSDSKPVRRPLHGRKTARPADAAGFVAVVPGSGRAAKKKSRAAAGSPA